MLFVLGERLSDGANPRGQIEHEIAASGFLQRVKEHFAVAGLKDANENRLGDRDGDFRSGAFGFSRFQTQDIKCASTAT